MVKKSSRNQELDAAKGLGILSVVIGHGYSHTTNVELLIYGFHMPFFFLISGIIYGQKQTRFAFDLRKKIRTLIVPYFFFEFMWWLCIALMNGKNPAWDGKEILMKTLAFRGNIATWYLPCLFLTELIFWLVIQTGSFQYFLLSALFAAGLTLPGQLNEAGLVMLRPLVGVGFFAFGYYLHRLFQKECTGGVYLALSIVYACITLQNGLILFYVREFRNILLFLMSSFIGTYLIIRLSVRITKSAKENKLCSKIFLFLCCCGENSLVIMCIHMFIMEALRVVDYQIFNNLMPEFGEWEGIIICGIIMLGCKILFPLLNKYFYFFIGKNGNFGRRIKECRH